MIFKKEFISKIINGTKTQTRRLKKHGSYLRGEIVYETHIKDGITEKKIKWKRGKDYTVQAGRGKKGLLKITITKIRKQKLLDITEQDAKAEGFKNVNEFLKEFSKIYGSKIVKLNPETWVLNFKKGVI